MIDLAPAALDDLRKLARFYVDRDRDAAVRNLDRQLDLAMRLLEEGTNRSRPAPAAYPLLAKPGTAWLKSGAYWFVHSLNYPPSITRIFHEAADIPGRYAP